MDKREALEIYMQATDECGVVNACNECVFSELFKGDRICILDYVNVDEVAMVVRDKLKSLDEKQEAKPSVPLENVGSIIIKKPSKRSAEEKCKNEQESFASGDNLSPVETKPIDRDIFIRPNDRIKHPSHYFKGGMECIDAIRAAVTDCRGFEAYCVGNIVKYVWRYKEKNGIEDLQKAEHYLKWLMEEVEKNETRR